MHSRNAVFTVPFLYSLFGNLSQTTIEQDRFLASLEQAISQAGATVQDLPQEASDTHAKARALLSDWTNKGYIMRFFSDGVQEMVCVTAAVGQLFRYIEDIISSERGIVGADSRFASILHQIGELEEKTTTDPSARIQSIETKIASLQEELAQIKACGAAPVYTPAQVHERLEELQRQCRTLLSDFRQLKDNNHSLFLDICRRQLEATESRGEILQYTIEGQNAITSSPQGQSFESFWSFLNVEDEEQRFQSQVEALQHKTASMGLEYDFSFLSCLEDRLYEEGLKVNDENHMLSSRLRRILLRYASGEYQRMQELSREVKSLSASLPSVPRGPWMETDGKVLLDTTFSRPLQLPNAQASGGPTDYELPPQPDSDELVRNVIDERTISTAVLRDRVEAMAMEHGSCTLGQVVETYPLTYGLEELLKYLTLVMRMDPETRTIDPMSEQSIAFRSYPQNTMTVVQIPKVTIHGKE